MDHLNFLIFLNTSLERGISTTGVMCYSPTGHYIPSMVIYRRKRIPEEMKENGPPGTLYACHENGWMSIDGFQMWFNHFFGCYFWMVKSLIQEI